MTVKRYILLLFALLLIAPSVRAQVSPAFYDYVRSDLKWYTIETEHFLVHFHAASNGEGSNRTARTVARIAEQIYGPITSLYDHEPDTKVSFILKDYEDYSNGAAYFFDNMIEIWAPALITPYRGDHNWLRNVISHEFTHMIQVQKSMKGGRKLPFYYLQVLDYEDVRRPDVLYGFPNVIASYPIPVLNNPAWLAEGTAQFQRIWMDYDRWDTHRDMLLRTRILAGKELSLADMGGFYSHTSLMRESVYNHGFALTQYLVDRFGEDGLRTLSSQLGNWSNWNFSQAADDAFGIPGSQIYTEWIAELRSEYESKTAEIRASERTGQVIEADGFNNFYPRYSPDGGRVAYLSNKGQDFSRTSLYIIDVSGNGIVDTRTEIELPKGNYGGTAGLTCSLGHALVPSVTGPISWRPDGKAVAYVRTEDTRLGKLYSDLYSFEIGSKTEKRLTRNLRATSPVYSPDGSQVAFIRQHDGSTNLSILTIETGEVTELTSYSDGSQVTEPAWYPGGGWIYFGLTEGHGRDIFRVNLRNGESEVVLRTAGDERTPAFDRDGKWLYYSSDQTGIFNLYRSPLDPATGLLSAGDGREQLTNELGGAFMADIGPGQNVVYASYKWDGYKISQLLRPEPVREPLAYSPPGVFVKAHPYADRSAEQMILDTANDSDIRPFSAEELRQSERSDSSISQIGKPRPYRNVFTSFSFLPVLRLDQYVSRKRSRTDVRLSDRTRLGTLWRNTKIGAYTASREIMNGLSMFGGLLIGPGSRSAESFGDFLSPSNLLKLERDLFLQFDYNKGLGIIPARWSPQFSLELFNIRRNVENGLAIEEFPCTACFPDTTLTDLSYNLWEIGLSGRSKVSRSLLLEAGVSISPYRVTTERFFSKELQQTIAESSSRYFIGKSTHIKLYYEAFHSYRNADVVPIGARIEFSFERENGRLLKEFSLNDGFLKPVYERSTINRVVLAGRIGFQAPGLGSSRGATGIGIRFRASSILGKRVDDFYDDYVGGLTGARGYPFYAMGGNETLWGQISYTFPLVSKIGKQFLFTYVDKIYARVYTDAAIAWSGSWPGLNNARKDTGMELRFGLGSYYLLPTAVFVSATYGLDTFEFRLDDGFVTPDGKNFVTYGRNVQWHVGVLFGFDQL